MNVQNKIDRFNQLQKKSNLENREKQELNHLAKEFLEGTKITYDRVAMEYANVNGSKMLDSYREMYHVLFRIAEEVLKKPIEDMDLLDVGTGSGRDIKYIYSRGIKRVVGIDNSEGFIKILEELQEKGEIPEGSFVKGDMLNIPFDDKTFDIVRQNASLLHIPITTKGEMLDRVLQESYRVLKENGILFVSVKKGEGVQLIDTKDGLGGRIFQMHTIESITKVLKENSFEILDITEIEEQRNENKINWINLIAKKH